MQMASPYYPKPAQKRPAVLTTRAKNERETIRSTLLRFCRETGLLEEQKRVEKYQFSWEMIADSVKWYPRKGEAVPDNFVKAVTFPVDQGVGQSGKGHRLLKVSTVKVWKRGCV